MSANPLQPYPVNQILTIIAEDIEFGIAQDSASCAIAHAIYRTFPDAMRVRVNRKTIAWSDAATDVRYVYPTPPRVDQEIIKPFDESRPDDIGLQRFTLTGGQFKNVSHGKSNAATRARLRRQKKEDPDAYDRAHKPKPYKTPPGVKPGSRSRIYERYVPTAEDL